VYFVYGRLWLWPVLDEDAIFFSQDRRACLESGAHHWRRADHTSRRVARCQYTGPWVWPQGTGVYGPEGPPMPVQCGMVAQPDALGRHLCARHRATMFTCGYCGGYLPQGDGGFCGSYCEEAFWEAGEELGFSV
jgi:hypothetical protein